MQNQEIRFNLPETLDHLSYCDFSHGLDRAYLYMSGHHVPGLSQSGYDFFSKAPKRKSKHVEKKGLTKAQFFHAIPTVMRILIACINNHHHSIATAFSISYFQLRATYQTDLLDEERALLKLLYESQYDSNRHLVRVLVYIGVNKRIIKKRSEEARYFWVYDDICKRHSKEVDMLLKDRRKEVCNSSAILSGVYSQSKEVHTLAHIIASTIALATQSDNNIVSDASKIWIEVEPEAN